MILVRMFRFTSKRPQEKNGEAIQLLERALSIQKAALGENHPDTVRTQNYLELVREEVRVPR